MRRCWPDRLAPRRRISRPRPPGGGPLERNAKGLPRQHSSGGKNKLGGITKRGDTYLRSLLIQGAKSAVMTAHKRSDPISQWAAALRDRIGWQKAAVALANR